MDKIEQAYQQLVDGVQKYVDLCISNLNYDRTYTAIINKVGEQNYDILLNGTKHEAIPVVGGGTCRLNETVKVVIPQGNYSNMFILKAPLFDIHWNKTLEASSSDTYTITKLSQFNEALIVVGGADNVIFSSNSYPIELIQTNKKILISVYIDNPTNEDEAMQQIEILYNSDTSVTVSFVGQDLKYCKIYVR